MMIPQKIRAPILNQHVESYLLITLLSFATTVAFTRLFLNLTGYPQIGGAELHIAHVLWGGLLLFIAALLPSIFVNRWALNASSLFAGIGVGLFIDEVGKFITRNNDYFYPAAAPIIYAFFLLTVLLYSRVRRAQRQRKNDPRTDLYYILQDLEEVIDHDLSENERARIISRLGDVEKSQAHPDMANLASILQNFIASETLYLVPEQLSTRERIYRRWLAIETRRLNRRRYRAVLTGGLAAWSAWMLLEPIRLFLSINTPAVLQDLFTQMLHTRVLRVSSGLNWFEIHIGLSGSIGLILFIAAVLLLVGKDRQAIDLAYAGLLISLAVVNLLIFYFDQFSTIIGSSLQFILLLGILRYRQLYLDEQPPAPTPPSPPTPAPNSTHLN